MGFAFTRNKQVYKDVNCTLLHLPLVSEEEIFILIKIYDNLTVKSTNPKDLTYRALADFLDIPVLIFFMLSLYGKNVYVLYTMRTRVV